MDDLMRRVESIRENIKCVDANDAEIIRDMLLDLSDAVLELVTAVRRITRGGQGQ